MRWLLFAVVVCLLGCEQQALTRQPETSMPSTNPSTQPSNDRVVRTDAEWKQLLAPLAYRVLRHAATEPPFTGAYHDNHAAGTYHCAGCGAELFSSAEKFESGTGWPSFWKPIATGRVVERADPDGSRTEVFCARCDGHLGHVFDDGPAPTGLRYCMNSAALAFQKAR